MFGKSKAVSVLLSIALVVTTVVTLPAGLAYADTDAAGNEIAPPPATNPLGNTGGGGVLKTQPQKQTCPKMAIPLE
jgi:hypothetical protein